MRKLLALLFSSVLFFVTYTVAQDLNIPDIHSRVTDQTRTFSANEIQSLESKLEQCEQQTSTQIAVLIIPTLSGESLDDYSLRVCEKNKFGKKGRDNGILLLIIKDDRKMRIEVGYGLESVLTDAISSQIIRNAIAPKFRSGDYYGGVNDAVNAMVSAAKGEFSEENTRHSRNTSPQSFITLIFLFMGFGLLTRIIRRSRRYDVSSRGWSSRSPWIGGFGGGGFGSSGGSSFGGGGFSGGGGSFGGGGASGSW